jgi:hypothetical protein
MIETALTDFERELLERVSIGGASFGVALDQLDEELLEPSPGRAAVEISLQGLPRSRLGKERMGTELADRTGTDGSPARRLANN